MTITIDLKPELTARLAEQAKASGLALADYLAKLVEQAAGATRNQAAAELLKSWESEDLTEEPAELEARRAEWEETKAAMNESHPSSRILFP
jgi:hypothetical protein